MCLFSQFLVFLIIALLGLLLTFILFIKVVSFQNSNKKASYIASLIRQGAMVFLRQEYSVLAIVIFIVALILGISFNIVPACAYVCGALSSMFAGYIGMDLHLLYCE